MQTLIFDATTQSEADSLLNDLASIPNDVPLPIVPSNRAIALDTIKTNCRILRKIIALSSAPVRTSAFLLSWKLLSVKDQIERGLFASLDDIGGLVSEVNQLEGDGR